MAGCQWRERSVHFKRRGYNSRSFWMFYYSSWLFYRVFEASIQSLLLNYNFDHLSVLVRGDLPFPLLFLSFDSLRLNYNYSCSFYRFPIAKNFWRGGAKEPLLPKSTLGIAAWQQVLLWLWNKIVLMIYQCRNGWTVLSFLLEQGFLCMMTVTVLIFCPGPIPAMSW